MHFHTTSSTPTCQTPDERCQNRPRDTHTRGKFPLARAAESDVELHTKLLTPPFKTILRVPYNKWKFTQFPHMLGLDASESRLCKPFRDVRELGTGKDMARKSVLKPVLGWALAKMFHLKPGEEVPNRTKNGLDVSGENHYIAQEQLYGRRTAAILHFSVAGLLRLYLA
ncbi:hypothetical protein Hypma_005458 [Hypsizygus marmoreus]|uniref:Uncharacterized protein n=1 Tax=Hypsizygus marmoreus TaxID=39966 RepID=A0A369J3T2_HYPMA|nr:hypothetical protein Hypma_005458 [Hypsizygus marmoreus]